ncbi:MAG: LptF/LptG family permease [bacterium]
MILLRKMDRYLIRLFLLSLLVVFLSTALTFIVINAVEELRDFIDHEVPLSTIAEYYFYFGGWVVKSFLPMFVLLATLFSISILARRHEILAMKACGISLYRIAAPLLLVAALLAGGHFYYSEYIFPPANQRRLEIKAFTIDQKQKRAHQRVRNVSRQISKDQFYTLTAFDVDHQRGMGYRSVRYEGNSIARIVVAEQLLYLDYKWWAIDGVERIFDTTRIETYHAFDTLEVAEIDAKPEDFAKRIGKPEDMGYQDLKRYITLMKKTGGPHIREEIDLQVKVAFPFSSCIVVLLSIPFAANPRRGGIAVSIAMGAIISLAYFVLFRTLQSAAYSEKIPQLVAVWGVNGLFFVIGLVSMLGARK